MGVSDNSRLAELEAVYEARLDDFVRAAAAITGGLESGRDAVHDAFVSAIRNLDQFRSESRLEAWVWQVVIHTALKARRQTRQRARHDSAEANRGETNGHLDEVEGLRATIVLLPERQRLILFLRYYADLDYQQIADALGLRRGTISAALYAAHQKLRQHLEEVPER
jgi:RNA polymerase sigma-70 factor (ECF subfamily)